MNQDVFKGKWKQLKGKFQEEWGELTNDELDRVEGNREQMIGLLQEKYGWKREAAEAKLRDVENRTVAH